MEDFNPRSPIRLSDIDNLLQESIFESSDGAKLVDYLKKKRGGGRVRLQNIFQQVPVQRAQFNFDLDSSEPTPLPSSPQPTTSNENYATEVITNGVEVQNAADPIVVNTMPDESGSSTPVPIVIVNDLNAANKATVKQIVLKSPGPMNTLSRQLLINQYQRTNAAKCELLKQLASSTPKPDSNGTMGRISTFTTSISPITEGDHSPLIPVEVIPSSQPVVDAPVHVMEIVIPPPASEEVLVPCSQPILAPCSQAVSTDATPKKVVVLKTVVEHDDVIIPETPSPVNEPTESPKAPPHTNQILPRRLSTTFKQMENAEEAAYANGHITSDDSEEEEEEEDRTESGSNSVLLKSILKDTSMGRTRHSMRVSFSKQLVQQREISPAPDIPDVGGYNDSNSSDDSDVSESDDAEDNDYQVVDEVYTDDDGDDRETYEELKNRICELNNSHNGRRSVSPLIDVVKETPVQWFETTTPTKRSDQQDAEEQQFPPPTTAKKDNKTNLQLVDIITDWDDEEDEEEIDHGAGNAEVDPSQEFSSEPRVSTNSNNHDTNLDTMDISSSNLEDSVERLVELPPAPNGLIEEEGVLPEEHIYPAAVDEEMPITTEELVDVLTGIETDEPQPEKCPESPKPVEEQPEDLPPPQPEPDVESGSPERVITPPIQFTNSAKRRFIQQNEDDLITRLQNDMPHSQASSAEADSNSQSAEEPLKSFEKVSETLVEIAQSFRDQPLVAAVAPSTVDTATRKVVPPPKRGGKKSNVDPVTASYFEAIEKTFAKPKGPPPAQRKKAEQKRKLYDATLSEVTEDDESMRGPTTKATDKAPTTEVQEVPKLRNLKIVVEKLNTDDYLPKKKSPSDVASQPKEPESNVTEPVVVQDAPPKPALKSRRASKDKPPVAANKAKGRPKKVLSDSINEQSENHQEAEILLETERPVGSGSVEEQTRDVSKKKHKLKPNLAGHSRQQVPDESVPNETSMADVEHETGKDKVVEKKKKKLKSNQGEEPDGSLVNEQNIQKDKVQEKKKKPKPNLAGDSQQQVPDESSNGTSTTNVDHGIVKDKILEKKKKKSNQGEEPVSLGKEQDIQKDQIPEKKKKPKPNLAADSQQNIPDESSNGTSTTNVDHDIVKDKIVEKKKKKSNQGEEPASLGKEQNIQKDQILEKKKKPKPNLAAGSQQHIPDESLNEMSTTYVDQDIDKDKVVEKKKKKLKSNQGEEPAARLEKENIIQKDQILEKKKKPKPNLATDSRQQVPDEGRPNGTPTADMEQGTDKDKVVATKKRRSKSNQGEEHNIKKDQIQEKKKKSKPNLAEDSHPQGLDNVVEKEQNSMPNQDKEIQQQRPDENLTTNNAEPMKDVEQDARTDKTKDKRIKLKPNLSGVPQTSQPEQLPAEPAQAVIQQSSEEVAAKKKKLRPNFGTKSKQQHAEVAPVVDEESRLSELTESGEEQRAIPEDQPAPTVTSAAATDKEIVKQKKKQSRTSLDGKKQQQSKAKAVTESIVQPEAHLKQLQVKVTKLAVAQATAHTSPAAKVIQQKVQPVAEPSPATSRKLFDDPEAQLVEVQGTKASEDPRKKRKETKRAKMKSFDPIPKVRISAEKDGLYRITTTGQDVCSTQNSFMEQLNMTGSDNSANVRSSLEECQDEFLGFEDGEDTIANMTVDLSRSNMELIIPLERTPIPKGVKIPSDTKKSQNPRRQSRSPTKKREKSRDPQQPKRKSLDTLTVAEPVAKAASPERSATIDNSSLPLKKRKSRDSSQEYLPSSPEKEPVVHEPALVDLNDSMLIPVLQRLPIADKYVVRSTPDEDAESTEYDTDDNCTTGENVLIVCKDTSRLDQSRIALEEEERDEADHAGSSKKKITNRRQSIPLPRFYGDNTFDITWRPRRKVSIGGGSRKNKRRLDNDSGIEEEDGSAVRRSKRTCRISKQILMTNPLIKSAYDRPNYRPMSVEQLLEAENIAKKLKEEEKAKRQRKQATQASTAPKPSQSPRSRKRIQAPVEAEEGQQQAKRNRTDSAVEVPEVPTTSSSSTSGTVSHVEVAVQVEEDPTVQQERHQAQSWMLKLMADNSGREEVMPQATSSGDRMHFTLDHLTFQERNGIQYSFFIYSETENFGFLRFAPAAVKKWTKTADFLLKFLVLNGQLSFQINGKETVTKGGDFLMLPQNTRYRIQNSDEISLVFMIKFRAASNELPSM